ncbi:MAG: hypothetical protein HOJ14_13145 [Nitrospina sp.]|nr:hypothetical protein [Nitrospina sp.]
MFSSLMPIGLVMKVLELIPLEIKRASNNSLDFPVWRSIFDKTIDCRLPLGGVLKMTL